MFSPMSIPLLDGLSPLSSDNVREQVGFAGNRTRLANDSNFRSTFASPSYLTLKFHYLIFWFPHPQNWNV